MSDTPPRDEQMLKTNKEVAQEWAMDVTQDPYAIPLEKLNVAHPALFKANAMLPYGGPAARRVEVREDVPQPEHDPCAVDALDRLHDVGMVADDDVDQTAHRDRLGLLPLEP